ncbi:MAG TPA: hypothetical protein VNO35_15185 [Steroidobacteraceae bacterium]|nr:hypothetical protein [Steroidobacteraceae bacterium]
MGLILREAIAYERGTWNPALYRGLTVARAQDAYVEAIDWAQNALALTSV